VKTTDAMHSVPGLVREVQAIVQPSEYAFEHLEVPGFGKKDSEMRSRSPLVKCLRKRTQTSLRAAI
jgi:hypothetical protein